MTIEDERARRWAAVYAERPRLLRIARRRTASEAEAEDCVSEAMLRCVEFDNLDEERLVPFLTTVVLRLCADQHRARARALRAGGRCVGAFEEASHEDDICDRFEASWLAGHLTSISPHQRRILEARAEGLSCDDVARRLGVSVDAVKSAAARVRCVARAALAKAYGLVPAFYWRRTPTDMALGGALAAVAGITVGGLLLTPAVPDRVALGPAEVAVDATAMTRVADPTAVQARVAARPRPATAVAVVAQPPAPLVASIAYERPGNRPGKRTTVVDDKRTPAGAEVYVQEDEYGNEHILHCLTEGVSLAPTIRCNYPEDRQP